MAAIIKYGAVTSIRMVLVVIIKNWWWWSTIFKKAKMIRCKQLPFFFYTMYVYYQGWLVWIICASIKFKLNNGIFQPQWLTCKLAIVCSNINCVTPNCLSTPAEPCHFHVSAPTLFVSQIGWTSLVACTRKNTCRLPIENMYFRRLLSKLKAWLVIKSPHTMYDVSDVYKRWEREVFLQLLRFLGSNNVEHAQQRALPEFDQISHHRQHRIRHIFCRSCYIYSILWKKINSANISKGKRLGSVRNSQTIVCCCLQEEKKLHGHSLW